MHPKIRELADTSQFSRRTVREAADYLPEDDAVLDAAIDHEKLEITANYTQVGIEQLKAVHGKTTPPGPAKTKTRNPAGIRYAESMTAETILQKSVRYDRNGKPLEVVIPYEEFVDFVETYGLDLSEDEKGSVREAKADRKAGRMENFVALEDLEKELGI